MKVNNKGNSLLFNLMMMMLVTFLGLRMLNFKLKTIKRTRYITQQYLCMKEYNGKTKHHIRNMKSINVAIYLAKGIEYLSIVFPALRPFIMAFNYLGKGVKGIQEAVHFAYMKNYYDWYKKGCIFSPTFIKTPYKHNGFLKRDKAFGTAVLRREKWKQILFALKEKFILKTEAETSGFFGSSYQTEEYALPNMTDAETLRLKKFSTKEALQLLLF